MTRENRRAVAQPGPTAAAGKQRSRKDVGGALDYPWALDEPEPPDEPDWPQELDGPWDEEPGEDRTPVEWAFAQAFGVQGSEPAEEEGPAEGGQRSMAVCSGSSVGGFGLYSFCGGDFG